MPNEQSQPVPLVSLGRVVIEDAKKLRIRSQRLQYCVLGLAILAVLLQMVPPLIDSNQRMHWLSSVSKPGAYLCAVTGLIVQGIGWWTQRVANFKHTIGSTIKRRAMLIDALGPSTEPLDIRLLRSQAGKDAAKQARSYPIPENYYASDEQYGLERLRHNLQESSFFTHCLYQKAATAAFIKSGITLACIIVGLLIVIPLATHDVGVVIANCILAFVSFLVGADYLSQAMNWRNGASTVEGIERRLEKIAPDSVESYMAAFADYEVATATATAVPTSLYEREREELDELWRNQTGQ